MAMVAGTVVVITNRNDRMKKIVCACPHHPALGLLLMRLGLGSVFVVHGWMKVSNLAGTVGFFATLGLPMWLAYLVSFIEFLGGIAIILGLGTRAAGYMIAAVMIGAMVTVKGSMGFVGGYEFDVVLLALALGLALTGAGEWSVDARCVGKSEKK